jgi:hypothetical protein
MLSINTAILNLPNSSINLAKAKVIFSQIFYIDISGESGVIDNSIA